MSPAVIAAYIIGVICGVVITIIIACCSLASELDRAEEERAMQREWEKWEAEREGKRREAEREWEKKLP